MTCSPSCFNSVDKQASRSLILISLRKDKPSQSTLQFLVCVETGDHFLPDIASFCEAHEAHQSGLQRIDPLVDFSSGSRDPQFHPERFDRTGSLLFPIQLKNANFFEATPCLHDFIRSS